MLSSLGVELGQGYLIGRPAYVPQAPRPFAELRPDRAKAARRSPAAFAAPSLRAGHEPAAAK